MRTFSMRVDHCRANALYLCILSVLTNMVTKNISITEEMAKWIKDKDLSLSKVVQRHLKNLMATDE